MLNGVPFAEHVLTCPFRLSRAQFTPSTMWVYEGARFLRRPNARVLEVSSSLLRLFYAFFNARVPLGGGVLLLVSSFSRWVRAVLL